MLRNKATLPALQKTYDESYLTCSTAVYYEGQVSVPTGSLPAALPISQVPALCGCEIS